MTTVDDKDDLLNQESPVSKVGVPTEASETKDPSSNPDPTSERQTDPTLKASEIVDIAEVLTISKSLVFDPAVTVLTNPTANEIDDTINNPTADPEHPYRVQDSTDTHNWLQTPQPITTSRRRHHMQRSVNRRKITISFPQTPIHSQTILDKDALDYFNTSL
jgi:hypothetical protein